MSIKQQAFDDLKRISKMFKGLLEIGEDLGNIASIDQAVQEAQVRLNTLRQAEEGAVNNLADLGMQLDAAKKELTQVGAQTRDAVAKILTQAARDAEHHVNNRKQDAEAVRAKAQAQAQAAIDSAMTQANLILDRASKDRDAVLADVARAKVELSNLDTIVAKRREHLSGVEEAVKARQSLHDEIVGKLNVLRQKF